MPSEILILDDDDAVRESLTDYFEDRGWHAVPAASAEEALEILNHRSPEVAIVDIRLGGMNGDAFILQANRLKPDLLFVICTGSLDFVPDQELKALRQVAGVVFQKPVLDLDALLDEIDRICATNRREVE